MTRIHARRIGVAAVAVLVASCSSSPRENPNPSTSAPTAAVRSMTPTPQPTPVAAISNSRSSLKRHSPVRGRLPSSGARRARGGRYGHQRHCRGRRRKSGTWAGASGVGVDGKRLTRETPLLTASVAKTVTAARRAPGRRRRHDDPVTDHLPARAVAAFNANGATIEMFWGCAAVSPTLLGTSNSSIQGPRPLKCWSKRFPVVPQVGDRYQNINYVLFGIVIEDITGRRLWNVFRTGVLDGLGLDGLVYPEQHALAADVLSVLVVCA